MKRYYQQTLEMLSSLCWEKASHVLSNWQDPSLAKKWERAAKVIKRASIHEAVIEISPEKEVAK